jgi:hypothetical protein
VINWQHDKVFTIRTFYKQYAYLYGLIYTYYMWSQSELNFLRLQINITEYTFVYVLRWMLTITTRDIEHVRNMQVEPYTVLHDRLTQLLFIYLL